MAQVQFVNKVKYNGAWYDAHTPFVVDDKDMPELVAKGAITIFAPEAAEVQTDVKPVDKMTINELKAFAQESGVDIANLEKKSDILNAIKAAKSS